LATNEYKHLASSSDGAFCIFWQIPANLHCGPLRSTADHAEVSNFLRSSPPELDYTQPHLIFGVVQCD
jgi:hypothetical protein